MIRPLIFTVAALSALAVATADAQAPLPLSDFHVVDRIAGADGAWDIASIDPATRRLYVGRGEGVMAVDLDSNKVIPVLVKGERVHAVVPLPGGRAISTNGNSDTATLFDQGAGRVIRIFHTGKKPDAAVYDPASGLVLVMNAKSGTVTLIDPARTKEVGSIVIGGALEFAVSDGRGRVYVNVEDRNEVAVIDTKKRQLVAHYPLADCEGPTGLAIDPKTGLLFSACANRIAKVIRSDGTGDVATLKIGSRPDTAIFDAEHRSVFIPCGGDGTLVEIAERSPTDVAVIHVIPTAPGARTGALDPKTGRFYLPTATMVQPPAGGKPAAAPGSFTILVVARS